MSVNTLPEPTNPFEQTMTEVTKVLIEVHSLGLSDKRAALTKLETLRGVVDDVDLNDQRILLKKPGQKIKDFLGPAFRAALGKELGTLLDKIDGELEDHLTNLFVGFALAAEAFPEIATSLTTIKTKLSTLIKETRIVPKRASLGSFNLTDYSRVDGAAHKLATLTELSSVQEFFTQSKLHFLGCAQELESRLTALTPK